MNIVFLDKATITLDDDMSFEKVETQGTLTNFDLSTPEQIPERAKEADAVIVNKALLQRETLEKLPNLKHIAVIATGYNNVDTEAARELGISVSNVSGYGRYTVPQHTFALILNLAGKVMEYAADVQKGDWEAQDSFTLLRYHTFELNGKTIGIVGFGAIGRGCAAIAEGFGMRVLVHDAFNFDHPTYENSPLEKLIEEADILTVHCPLTEQTRDLLGERELKRMKRSAFVINTARGGIINEEALVKALESGEIAGAGLDSLSQEPPREHPLLYRDDLNLIVTPHCAWSAKEARQRLIDEVAANIEAFKSGKERNIVN
jgi:glycerate dehydrogenase